MGVGSWQVSSALPLLGPSRVDMLTLGGWNENNPENTMVVVVVWGTRQPYSIQERLELSVLV